MSALREILARFDVKFDGSELKKGGEAVDAAQGAVKKLGAALTAAAIIGGLAHIVSQVREMGDQLDKASKGLGVTAQQLQAYRHAAGLSGVATEMFDQGMRVLQKNASMAASGNADLAAQFKKLGVDVKDSHGNVKGFPVLLEEMADGLQKVETPAERSRIAMTVLGDAGARMIPMLKDGSGAVRAMTAELAEYGGGISDAAVQASADLTDSMSRFDLGMLSIKSRIAMALMPGINMVVGGAAKLAGWFANLADNTNLLQSALVVLGAFLTVFGIKAAIAMAPLLLPLLKAGLIIGLLILAVDELITTFQGGDSLISRAIDSMFGAGSTAKAVKWVKGVWKEVTGFFKDLFSTSTKFEEDWALLWQTLGKDIQALLFGWATAFDNWVSKIGSDFAEFFSILGTQIANGWQSVEDWLMGALKWFVSQFAAAAMAISDFFTGIWDGLIGGARAAVDGVMGVLKDAPLIGDLFTGSGSVSAPAGGQTVTQTVNQVVNVSATAGTPAGLPRAVGRTTSSALGDQLGATRAALSYGYR